LIRVLENISGMMEKTTKGTGKMGNRMGKAN